MSNPARTEPADTRVVGPAERRVRRAQKAGLGAILLATVAVYGPLVVADPVLERDDRRLIEPLEKISKPGEYLEAWADGRILDRQPARDLSFAVNLQLRRWTGRSTFHLTNLLLWWAIIWVFHRLTGFFTSSPWIGLGLTAVFALHPVFVGSVAWIAARKHLLSALFAFGATLSLMRSASVGWATAGKLSLLYGLSVLSQPITLLWPAWAALRQWLAGRGRAEGARVLLACAPVGLACAAINYRYYTAAFVAQTGAQKLTETEGGGAVALLALGRYFANLVLPVRLATSYYPGSWLNLLGLLGLVLFVAATLKWRSRAEGVVWLGLFLCPLLIVTARMTNIFVSDTYLLVPAVGAMGLASLWLPRQPPTRAAHLGTAALCAIAALLAVQSRGLARTWRSEAELWAHAAEVEPTPNALAKHAYYLAASGRTAEAIEVALRLGDWEPGHPEYPLVLAKAVYLDRRLSADQKLGLLHARKLEGPWPDYFEGWLWAAKGHFDRAHEHIDRALSSPESFSNELFAVAAEAEYLCERAGKARCQERTQKLRARLGERWQQASFEARRAALRH